MHCRLVGLQCAGTDPLDLQVFFAAFNSIYKKLVSGLNEVRVNAEKDAE